MCTARLLPVSPSMHCSRGDVPGPRGVYLPGGMYLPRGVYLPGGCTCPGGVPAWEVYLPGGTCPGTPPPWTEFFTHASENITLQQTSFAGGKDGILGGYSN